MRDVRKTILAGGIAGLLTVGVAVLAGGATPYYPAVRIQGGDGGTLGLAHTLRLEGAAAPSVDGGVASIYIAPGAGGVLSVSGTAPVASSGGLTPAISIAPCAATQILKSDGGAWGCAADERGVVSVTGTAPVVSSGGAAPSISLAPCVWPNQVLKSTGSGWYCGDDEDSIYYAGNQLVLTEKDFDVVEGAGSDLDADLLDGQEPGALAVATAAALAANPVDCAAGQFATAIAANGNLTCSTPPDADSLGSLSCANGQLPYWNDMGGEWSCGDPPAGTVPTCVEGQILKWVSGAWACSSVVAVPTCSAGQILKWSGSAWVCASQFTASSCPSGQVAVGINSSGGVACAGLYVTCGGTECSYSY